MGPSGRDSGFAPSAIVAIRLDLASAFQHPAHQHRGFKLLRPTICGVSDDDHLAVGMATRSGEIGYDWSLERRGPIEVRGRSESLDTSTLAGLFQNESTE